MSHIPRSLGLRFEDRESGSIFSQNPLFTPMISFRGVAFAGVLKTSKPHFPLKGVFLGSSVKKCVGFYWPFASNRISRAVNIDTCHRATGAIGHFVYDTPFLSSQSWRMPECQRHYVVSFQEEYIYRGMGLLFALPRRSLPPGYL